MQPLVVYGGTFDPVHLGHLQSAADVLDYLHSGELRLVPSKVPPHRAAPLFSMKQRLRMLELALDFTPGLVLDRRECCRAGPSYMVETLRSFRSEIGDRVPLVLVLGIDAFAELHHWYQWERVLDLASLVILDRPGYSAGTLHPKLTDLMDRHATSDPGVLLAQPAGLLHIASLSQVRISATQIRELINNRQSVQSLVPDAVNDYIQSQVN